jgi:hypothetical protein
MMTTMSRNLAEEWQACNGFAQERERGEQLINA